MASSIKQRITKAKKELQDHISSEGIDVTPHKDDIEQMKDILENESFEAGSDQEYDKTSSNDINGFSEGFKTRVKDERLQVLEPDHETEDGLKTPEHEKVESQDSKVENNLDKLEKQIELLESHKDEEEDDNIDQSGSQASIVKEDEGQQVEKNRLSEENRIEQDSSSIASDGINSDLDLEPSKIEKPTKEDFEESKESENSVSKEVLEDQIQKNIELEKRIDDLESELNKHEKNMVSGESEELSKISQLENRVENLELEDDSDIQNVEQKIGELENKIESLEHLESLEDRLNEIEQQLIEDGSVETRIKEFFDREIGQPVSEKELSEVQTRVEELHKLLDKGLEDFDQKADKIWEMVEEVDSNRSSVSENDLDVLDSKVDELRDMIEEVESNASTVSKEDVEQLSSKIDKLWEMVEEVDSNASSVSEEDIEEVDSKVEKLWEAMDEEMASVESRIHEDEQDMEDITSMVVELSELVKQKLGDH